MAETKWTPGPWELLGGYLIRKIEGDLAVPIAELRTPFRPNVGLFRGSREEWGNGHLIAAAPELYESLDHIVSGWERRISTVNALQMVCDSIAPAKVALAKARGEA